MSCATIPVIEFKIRKLLSTGARTSSEVKISIEVAWVACLESKDKKNFLPLPLFVPIAEFDPVDQCVGCSMSVRTEMFCDGKTRRILDNALEMFTKTFTLARPGSL